MNAEITFLKLFMSKLKGFKSYNYRMRNTKYKIVFGTASPDKKAELLEQQQLSK